MNLNLTFTYAVLVNVFGIGVALGLALGLFVAATFLRIMLHFVEKPEKAEEAE
jgi:flagellar biosynthesis protein FliR